MTLSVDYYFGGARSKGFATLRNVSKLQFFAKIGHAKSVGFQIYESRISSRYLEITSISLIYSSTFSRKKELYLASPGFEPTSFGTRLGVQVRDLFRLFHEMRPDYFVIS